MTHENIRELKPKLRFPEFRDAPGWEGRQLAEVCDLYQPVTISSSAFVEDGEHCVYGANGIIGKYYRFNHEFPEVIITCRGATCGEVHFTKAKSWITGNAMVASPKTSELSKFFLYRFFLASDLGSVISGSAQPQITRQGFAQFPLFLPTLPEQQKIADCLISLDELIAAHGRKLDALKAHKKRLMQQLFPRAGETLPRLRFPEFRDAPEWTNEPLGIFETMTGGTPDRAKKEYWNGTIPWITTSLVNFNIIENAEQFITEAGLANSSAKLFPKGTVLLAMYGQGKTRGKTALLGIDATTNQACAAILPRKEIEPAFTFLYLCGRYHELRGLSNSGGQENLSQRLIHELSFVYPKDIAEQQKIVDCLFSLDDLINFEVTELDLLKVQKNGLMQQLFPSPEEVEA